MCATPDKGLGAAPLIIGVDEAGRGPLPVTCRQSDSCHGWRESKLPVAVFGFRLDSSEPKRRIIGVRHERLRIHCHVDSRRACMQAPASIEARLSIGGDPF